MTDDKNDKAASSNRPGVPGPTSNDAPAHADRPNPALREIDVKGLPPEKAPSKRLFVGARVSIATANNLSQAVETIARRAGSDVKWVSPANYHVTLKFLGWTRSEAVDAIRDKLAEAAHGTKGFTLKTSRLGAFPSLEKANIVWAGVESAELVMLAEKVETAMEALGFTKERRSFHPHVTLGRLRESRPLNEAVLPVSEQMFGDTRVDSITLFESETKSSGSVYREVARIAFESASITPEQTAERQTRALSLGAPTASSDSRGRDEDTDDGWPRGQGQPF
ncbi:MAG: RNA 2',3'-cyclic phosphodiesterase [Kofleriaceae bacterium]